MPVIHIEISAKTSQLFDIRCRQTNLIVLNLWFKWCVPVVVRLLKTMTSTCFVLCNYAVCMLYFSETVHSGKKLKKSTKFKKNLKVRFFR